MKKQRLGKQGPEVSALGLGCMAMSEFYGPSDDKESTTLILSALEQGVTMLDTADTYGHGHNEELIGRALKQWPVKSLSQPSSALSESKGSIGEPSAAGPNTSGSPWRGV